MLQNKTANLKQGLATFFVFCVIGIVIILNNQITRSLEKSSKAEVAESKEVSTAAKKPIKKEVFLPKSSPGPSLLEGEGKLVRRSRIHPNRLYFEDVFFKGDKEMLRCKSADDKFYDCTGEIPDGKYKFFNETTGAHGEEFFDRGKRHGTYKEFYPQGELQRQITYLFGNKREVKEFFIDGIVKMEINLSDAAWFDVRGETGVGKVYYREGTLMYEWRHTSVGEGYKKSYNKDGSLRTVEYYDGAGKLIKRESQRDKTLAQ